MKTTAEKIAVMQACLPDFSNLEVKPYANGDWYDWNKWNDTKIPEPQWDWMRCDYRIKPPEPKKHEKTMWAHLVRHLGEEDVRVYFEIANRSVYPGYQNIILAVKPITFTITEGEGLEVSNG